MSSISGWLLYKENEKTIINEFHNDVNERAASIYREVTINFESLRSLAILFSDGTIPDFERFSFEAKNILSRYSDIHRDMDGYRV